VGEDGEIVITAATAEGAAAAAAAVGEVTTAAEVGAVVEGRVVDVQGFGYIVAMGEWRTALLHSSQVRPGSKLGVGDEVRVKVVSAEDVRNTKVAMV
jgi:polyribonucleotide nucleotidyltransferase